MDSMGIAVYVRSCCILIILLVMTGIVKSETLRVEYKTFYSHLNKLDSDDTQALQFAFGFVNIHTKQLCNITSAQISTDKQQLPISVTAESRFTLPTDRVLKLAKAIVVIELSESSNICDISVQLETKAEYLKTRYSTEELEFIYQQYTNFFDNIGSFMSFMMPSVEGIMIQFKDKTLSFNLLNDMQVNKGMLSVQGSDLLMLNDVDLPQKPLRITAITSK